MSRRTTTAQLAEQAGGALAMDCLDDMLAAKTQGLRVATLQTAILDLQRLPHPKRAAGGFAVALVNALERGLGLSK